MYKKLDTNISSSFTFSSFFTQTFTIFSFIVITPVIMIIFNIFNFSDLNFNMDSAFILFSVEEASTVTSEVTSVNTEIVARRVGSGLATAGLGGVGTGIGLVFSGLIKGFARNPSLKDDLFSYAIFGFALTEAIGLFALMMAFMLLYA